jgi:hypothetical protein
MHFDRVYTVKAPARFVYEWMTTPTPEDGGYTRGLVSREVTEAWKNLQNTTKDRGTLAGGPYESKAVLRKYPPSQWRVEEEAGRWYHRTAFSVDETPAGAEMKVSMEIIVRGWRRWFARAFRRKFADDFSMRIDGWVAKMEEEAKALPEGAYAAGAPKKKEAGPRDIPKQYGS